MKTNSEKKWQEGIEKAKYLRSSMDLPQLEIARIALGICEITWGGAKSKIRNNPYTITKFANEIGVNVKTVSNWVAAYKNVYSRLEPENKAELSYTGIVRIAKEVNRNTPVDEVNRIAEKYLSEDSYEMRVQRYTCHLRSLAYNFEHHSAHLRCSDETLAEILFYCRVINRRIRKKKNRIFPMLSGIAAKSKTGNLSSARAVLGGN